jgi:hypothetical protein
MVHPTLGMVSYAWRGVQVQRASAVHGLWLFQLAQDAANALSGDVKQKLAAWVERTGGQKVMDLRLPRALERQNNLMVLK